MRKNVGRLISALVILLLSSEAASAGGVRELLGAPLTYQATWTSNTGKTVITLDAPVEISSADTYPVIEVGRRKVTVEEALALANAMFGEGGYSGEAAFIQDAEYAALELMYLMSKDALPDGREKYRLSALNSTAKGVVDSARIDLGRVVEKDKPYYIINAFPYEITGDYARGSTVSLSEARAIADKLALSVAPELALAGYGEINGDINATAWLSSEEDISADARAYVFYYTRPVAGTPTTYTTIECNTLDRDLYNVQFYYEVAAVCISDVGLFDMYYNAPYELLGTLTENCDLLPFEDIMNVAKALLPIKLTYLERYYQYVTATIDRVTLGYARVQMADKPNRYMLTPVWDFFGNVITGGEALEDGTLYQSQLTIDAVRGTVIDRSYGY